MSEVVHVTDADFEDQVLKADVPVLVDFYADWCQPCKLLAPVVEALAGEYGEKLKVCKLDVSANSATAARYWVMSIPMVILFKNGELTDQTMGFTPNSKSDLKTKIDAAIG